MRILRGVKEICEFFGTTRVPTIYHYRKKFPDFPVFKDGSTVCAATNELREWGLKHGKIQPENEEELKIFNTALGDNRYRDRHKAKPAQNEEEDGLSSSNNYSSGQKLSEQTISDLFNSDKLDEIKSSDGTLMGDLEDARRLKDLFRTFVFSFNEKKLARNSKIFIDLSKSLITQLKAIATIENQIQRQKMRLGELLDEESQEQLAYNFKTIIMSSIEELKTGLLDIANQEFSRLNVTGFDSDAMKKKFEELEREVCEQIANEIERCVEDKKELQNEKYS